MVFSSVDTYLCDSSFIGALTLFYLKNLSRIIITKCQMNYVIATLYAYFIQI